MAAVTYRSDARFKRSMTLQSAMFIAIGGQIGSGWLFAVLSAAGMAGPSAVISWLIGGALVTLIALSWMEVGAALPFSGAIVRYPYLSHGGLTGWLMGMSYWLANLALPPIEAVAAITYVGGLFPNLGLLETRQGISMLAWPNGIITGIVVMFVFMLINIFGVKLLSEANRWITWWKIIIPTATFALLFLVFNVGNYTDYAFFGNAGGTKEGFGATFQAVAISGIAFAMMGFRGVIDFAGEVKNPKRNIPLGTIGSILIPLGIYTGLQIAFIGAINWADAGVAPGDWASLMSSSWADGPLGAALKASGIALLGAFVSLLLLDAVISPGAAGYLYLGSASRVAYGLATNKFFPSILTRMNRHGVPAWAIIVNFAIGLAFFLPAPSWYRLVGFISSALVLSTLTAPAAIRVMRHHAPQLHRPYRLPWSKVLAPIGFIASTIIIFWCGFITLANLDAILLGSMVCYAIFFSVKNGWTKRTPSIVLSVVFLIAWTIVCVRGGFILAPSDMAVDDAGQVYEFLIGITVLTIAFLLILRLMTKREGVRHLRAGYWLVFLLLAELILSAFSEYGPLPTPAVIFPWDSLIAVVIGYIAYLGADKTGFATPELKALEQESIEREAAGGDEVPSQPGEEPTPANDHSITATDRKD